MEEEKNIGGKFFKDKGIEVPVDYNVQSPLIQKFKPVVFPDGDSYCCIYGDDFAVGVTGCGKTVQEALDDWEKNFRSRE